MTVPRLIERMLGYCGFEGIDKNTDVAAMNFHVQSLEQSAATAKAHGLLGGSRNLRDRMNFRSAEPLAALLPWFKTLAVCKVACVRLAVVLALGERIGTSRDAHGIFSRRAKDADRTVREAVLEISEQALDFLTDKDATVRLRALEICSEKFPIADWAPVLIADESVQVGRRLVQILERKFSENPEILDQQQPELLAQLVQMLWSRKLPEATKQAVISSLVQKFIFHEHADLHASVAAFLAEYRPQNAGISDHAIRALCKAFPLQIDRFAKLAIDAQDERTDVRLALMQLVEYLAGAGGGNQEISDHALLLRLAEKQQDHHVLFFLACRVIGNHWEKISDSHPIRDWLDVAVRQLQGVALEPLMEIVAKEFPGVPNNFRSHLAACYFWKFRPDQVAELPRFEPEGDLEIVARLEILLMRALVSKIDEHAAHFFDEARDFLHADEEISDHQLFVMLRVKALAENLEIPVPFKFPTFPVDASGGIPADIDSGEFCLGERSFSDHMFDSLVLRGEFSQELRSIVSQLIAK